MARLINFKLDETTTVLVEASDDDDTGRGQERVSANGVSAEVAEKTFRAALARIGPIAAAIRDEVRKAVDEAEEVQVEFAVKLTATAGALLAKASTEGHCRVLVKWTRG